jgi:hypothetical protein
MPDFLSNLGLLNQLNEADSLQRRFSLTDEQIDMLDVPEINRILLAELKKVRHTMTSDQALRIVLESLDNRIDALERDQFARLPMSVSVPMMW